MRVCLCDKCKKQTEEVRYIGFDVGDRTAGYDEYTFHGHAMSCLELCEDCFNELMNLWEGTSNAL